MPRNRNKTYAEQRISRIRSYGITEHDYDRMLEEQDNGCYLCGKTDRGKALSIDHDHNTGKVRGLLCSIHNRALGLMNDDPELMLLSYVYLTKNHD